MIYYKYKHSYPVKTFFREQKWIKGTMTNMTESRYLDVVIEKFGAGLSYKTISEYEHWTICHPRNVNNMTKLYTYQNMAVHWKDVEGEHHSEYPPLVTPDEAREPQLSWENLSKGQLLVLYSGL